MFQFEDQMCCSTCFAEMIPLLTDEDGKPITYICTNCGKLADIFDQL